jgi:hypothetical protein
MKDQPSERAEQTLTLALSDLVSDANGEIVLYNDAGLSRVAIAAASEPVARGEAAPHVTAAGADVTGLHYVAFAGGPTLYYHPDIDIVIRADVG